LSSNRKVNDGYILEELGRRWEKIFYKMSKLSTLTALKSEEKRWKRQVHSAVKTWNSAMLLCAVVFLYGRLVRAYKNTTWESDGKTG
jgi:hypothetical protein